MKLWPGDKTAHWDKWTIPGQGNWLLKLKTTYGEADTNVFLTQLDTFAFTWRSVATLRDIALAFAGQQYTPISNTGKLTGLICCVGEGQCQKVSIAIEDINCCMKPLLSPHAYLQSVCKQSRQ